MPASIASDRLPPLVFAPEAPRTRWIPALALLVALVALARAGNIVVPKIPVPVWALGVGVMAGNIAAVRSTSRGRDLPVEMPLLVGLILVAVQVQPDLLGELGFAALAITLATIAATGLTFAAFARLKLMPTRLAATLALGMSGFGVSAIAAVAAQSKSRDTIHTYAATTVLVTGAIALLVMPALADFIGLSDVATGAWIGAGVANTAEAVAAAARRSPDAMQISAAIKLAVNAVQGIPIVIFLMLANAASRESANPTAAAEGQKFRRLTTLAGRIIAHVPPFVWGFLAVGIVAVADGFSDAERAAIHNLTRWLFLIALVGIGFRTRLAGLRALGITPLIRTTLAWFLLILALAIPSKIFL